MTDEPTRVTGYAFTHGEHPVYGGLEHGGWLETIPREVLESAAAETPSIPVRLGLDGPVIGEAALSVDDVGLRLDCDLNWGVGLRVEKQEWADDYTRRSVAAVKFQYGYFVPTKAAETNRRSP